MNGVAVSSAQQSAAAQGQGTQVLAQVAADPKRAADNAVVAVGANGGVAPAPTLANGLPGATELVPNNNDPNPVARTGARNYDVTLSAMGTTTLSSLVTVDHFSVTGGGAKLTVAPGAALVALSEID